jgi:hypothetical protein
MPPVIVAAIGTVAMGVYGGLTISAIIATTLIASATTALGMALAPKPLKAENPGAGTLLRQPVPVGAVVYGRARVGPAMAFFGAGEVEDTIGEAGEVTPGNTGSLHMIIVLAVHEVAGLVALYDGDKIFWTAADGMAADYADKVGGFAVRLGTDTQGPIEDFIAAVPSSFAGDTGLNFRLRGAAYVWVELLRVKSDWQALPQLWAEVDGATVYDPRIPAWVHSGNPALCAADYLTRDRGGVGFDWSVLDEAALIAAANICDEAVALSDGGDAPRYRINGSIQTDAVPRDVLNSMMLLCGGQVADVGGRLVIQAGAYAAPVATIGPGDMMSAAKISRAVNVEGMPDGVGGTFTNAETSYQPDGLPVTMFADYAPEDGAARVLDVNFERETLAERAQRCAVIAARKARRSVALSVDVAPRFGVLEVGDAVSVDLPQAGLAGAVFEVIGTTWRHSPGRAVVALELIETGPEVWAWSVGDALGVASVAATGAPSSRTVEAPGAPAVAAVTRLAADGSAVPSLLVTWAASPDFWLSRYRVTWTPDGGAPRSAEVPAEALAYEIRGEAEGVPVSVEVAAVNIYGRASDGTGPGYALAPVLDTDAPSVPADFAAAGGVDRVALSWTVPPELDFSAVIVREAAADDFAASVEVWRGNAASCERSGVSVSDPRFWWSASVDRSGNVSAWVGPVSAASTQVQAGQVAADAIGTAQIVDGSAVDYGAAYDAGAVGVAGGSVWTVVQSVRVWRDAPGALAIWCGCGFQGGAPNSGEGDVPTPVYFRVLVDGVEVAALSKTGEGISGRFEGHTVLENAAAGGLSTVTMQLKGISSLEGVARTLTAIMLKRSALPVLPPI